MTAIANHVIEPTYSQTLYVSVANPIATRIHGRKNPMNIDNACFMLI